MQIQFLRSQIISDIWVVMTIVTSITAEYYVKTV